MAGANFKGYNMRWNVTSFCAQDVIILLLPAYNNSGSECMRRKASSGRIHHTNLKSFHKAYNLNGIYIYIFLKVGDFIKCHILYRYIVAVASNRLLGFTLYLIQLQLSNKSNMTTWY